MRYIKQTRETDENKLDKISINTITFFSLLNEYDFRSYLRDCADIFVFKRKELIENYPVEVFNFIKLARFNKNHLTDIEFLDFIERITNNNLLSMNTFIQLYVNQAIATLKRDCNIKLDIVNKRSSNEDLSKRLLEKAFGSEAVSY